VVERSQQKRRDGVLPDIHSFGFTTVIRKRLYASISRAQIYQIARLKSSNIFVFRADWVRSRYSVRSCVKKNFRVFWRFPRREKGRNLKLPNHSFGEMRICSDFTSPYLPFFRAFAFLFFFDRESAKGRKREEARKSIV
jgi:hypothetical protein